MNRIFANPTLCVISSHTLSSYNCSIEQCYECMNINNSYTGCTVTVEHVFLDQ